MHEQAYIDAILKNIDDVSNIKNITLEVGELAGIEPEHLKEHLKDRFSWDITILKKDAKIKCECGFVGRPKVIERLHDFVVFECPRCKSTPKILNGEDIKITKILYN